MEWPGMPMEPSGAVRNGYLSSAWVVGFNKELYPGNPTYGPFAGRPGSVRFSPVKGSKVQAVQRAPPAPTEKLSRKKSNVLSDSESSDSDGESVAPTSRWEDELLAHLLLPASPLKTGSA